MNCSCISLFTCMVTRDVLKVFQIALAYGSCNFENFRNITCAHKSRNALAFVRFPILIDYACSVKMAGYWPSAFFAFLWTKTKLRPITNYTKKRMKPISSHLDRTSLVNKGFIIMAKRLHQVSPSMHRRMFLLLVSKMNRSKLIFVHLTLSDTCNNQCFVNCVIL